MPKSRLTAGIGAERWRASAPKTIGSDVVRSTEERLNHWIESQTALNRILSIYQDLQESDLLDEITNEAVPQIKQLLNECTSEIAKLQQVPNKHTTVDKRKPNSL